MVGMVKKNLYDYLDTINKVILTKPKLSVWGRNELTNRVNESFPTNKKLNEWQLSRVLISLKRYRKFTNTENGGGVQYIFSERKKNESRY